MSQQIFISYRRGDSQGTTGRLYDRILDDFSKEQVFMDVDTILPGEDFVEAIENAVEKCDILIVVIGKKWIDIQDRDGNRMLDNVFDFVRVEIRTALLRNVRLIPVLVENAQMPNVKDLPDDLKALARRNAIEISHTRFNSDVDRLIKTLQEILKKINEREQKSRVKKEIDNNEAYQRLVAKNDEIETIKQPTLIPLLSRDKEESVEKDNPRSNWKQRILFLLLGIILIGAIIWGIIHVMNSKKVELEPSTKDDIPKPLPIDTTQPPVDSKKEMELEEADIAFETASNFMTTKQYDSAIKYYKVANQKDPNCNKALIAKAYKYKGDVYESLGKHDSAINYYTESIRLNGQDFETYTDRAISYQKNKNDSLALNDYNDAIDINSEYARAYRNRGRLFHHTQDYSTAIKDFDKAIRLEPNFNLAFFWRGECYDYKGDKERALRDYKEMIRLNSKYAVAYYRIGEIYQHEKKFDSAIEAYKNALEIDPKFKKAEISLRKAEEAKDIEDYEW